MERLKKNLRSAGAKFSLLFFSLILSFLIFVGWVKVQGAFLEPPLPAPFEPTSTLNYPFHTGLTPQEKPGWIYATNFWINSQNRWATQLRTRIESRVVSTGGDNTVSVTVHCRRGYELIGCSAAMDHEAAWSCGNPRDCGLIGVIPVNPDGTRTSTSTAAATGCAATIDGDGGTEAAVFAYCLEKSF